MRSAFEALWTDKSFLSDYSKAVKTEPGLVTGADGERVISQLSDMKPEVKTTLEGVIKSFAK
jgi:hypothetical protein